MNPFNAAWLLLKQKVTPLVEPINRKKGFRIVPPSRGVPFKDKITGEIIHIPTTDFTHPDGDIPTTDEQRMLIGNRIAAEQRSRKIAEEQKQQKRLAERYQPMINPFQMQEGENNEDV